jgi:corrinoid protein of di/trimethylamine methyltransferase
MIIIQPSYSKQFILPMVIHSQGDCLETSRRREEKGGIKIQEVAEMLEKAVCNMDGELAKKGAQQVLDSGGDVLPAINDGLVKGMKIVADQYDKEEIFLPQVLASANAFYAAFELLRPKMLEDSAGSGDGHSVVIGVVEGDIHDIGKNLVKTIMEANGFNCIDMGRDVPVEDFSEKVVETSPSFVAMSTLMTPTMKNMQRIIEEIVEEDMRDGLKIIIGGGPVDSEFAEEIGADYYGDNESDAVKWLRKQAGGA